MFASLMSRGGAGAVAVAGGSSGVDDAESTSLLSSSLSSPSSSPSTAAASSSSSRASSLLSSAAVSSSSSSSPPPLSAPAATATIANRKNASSSNSNSSNSSSSSSSSNSNINSNSSSSSSSSSSNDNAGDANDITIQVIPMSDVDPHRATPGVILARILFSLLLVYTAYMAVLHLDHIQRHLMDAFTWVQQLNLLYGALVFTALNIIGALLFLPCLPFTLAAGLLYGLVIGTIVVTIASSLAALVAFLTARYLARKFVEKKIMTKGVWFRSIDNAIKEDGFRIVFLIRSSPIHPYGVCNYLFGLTSVTTYDYMVAGTTAMLPGIVMEVYFGTALKSLSQLLSGDVEESVASQVFFYCGLVATIASTVYITVLVRKKLSDELDGYKDDDGGGGGGGGSNTELVARGSYRNGGVDDDDDDVGVGVGLGDVGDGDDKSRRRAGGDAASAVESQSLLVSAPVSSSTTLVTKRD